MSERRMSDQSEDKSTLEYSEQRIIDLARELIHCRDAKEQHKLREQIHCHVQTLEGNQNPLAGYRLFIISFMYDLSSIDSSLFKRMLQKLDYGMVDMILGMGAVYRKYLPEYPQYVNMALYKLGKQERIHEMQLFLMHAIPVAKENLGYSVMVGLFWQPKIGRAALPYAVPESVEDMQRPENNDDTPMNWVSFSGMKYALSGACYYSDQARSFAHTLFQYSDLHAYWRDEIAKRWDSDEVKAIVKKRAPQLCTQIKHVTEWVFWWKKEMGLGDNALLIQFQRAMIRVFHVKEEDSDTTFH